MMGGEVTIHTDYEDQKKVFEKEEVLLEGKDMSIYNAQHRELIRHGNLTMKAGEIIGLAGISGRGQRELLETLFGVNVLKMGQLTIDGKDMTKSSIRDRIEAGMALVSEDPKRDNVVAGMKIYEHFALNGPEISYKKGNVRMEDNRVSDFQLNGVSGEMILRNNVMRQLDVESKEGSIFLYTPNFKGNSKIKTDEGHITAVTKRLPWSLLISAKASGDGDVQVNYHKRFWKKPDVILKNKRTWQGAVGDNPRTILTLQTKDGHITVDQRNRYTDTQADLAA